MELKDTAKILFQQAKLMQSEGKIPLFLGVKGMLARMYDNITRYSDSDDQNGDYVLDLAVNALFAMQLVYENLGIGEAVETHMTTDDTTTDEIPDIPDGGRAWKEIKPE